MLLATLLLIGRTSALQRDDGVEDYGPEGGGPPGGPDSGSSVGKADPSSGALSGDPGAEGADKAGLDGADGDADPAKTKFSDDRFAKLFPSRGANRNFHARNVAKPKPTLPSFIKSTPPLLKVQVSTTPAPRGGRGRASLPTTKRSQTSTTSRPRRGNALQVTPRQLSGRLTTSAPSNRATSAPNSATASATPSAAALAAARRARQGNGISRFNRNMSSGGQPNSNSTIPALNPRRNN